MLNIASAKKIVIVGGGTAGWFAALTLRRYYQPDVEVRVIASSEIGIVGVGEGGLPNIADAIVRNKMDTEAFYAATGGTYKWGFSYEGWRTGAVDDRFFHLFYSTKSEGAWRETGFYPNMSALINQGIPLEYSMRGYREAIAVNVTQEESRALLATGQSDIPTSFHFDSYKTAQYLQETAVARGVTYMDSKITQVIQNAQGHVTTLKTEHGDVEADFVVDASGLSRLVIGKMNTEWESFKQYLPMDSAIPFYMKHPFKNPALYTRAVAMKAGWMWQIPLQARVGAGYVFSSAHITPEQAAQEVHDYLGYEVNIQKTIRFDPGCYRKVWVGNVLALGLSAGFVEPLEATSIGQMLEQLEAFERTLAHTRGFIPQTVIDNFNQANHASWLGVRDFLCMHYDCPRRDNDFWQDIARLPRPQSYLDLKETWQHRTPRVLDTQQYAQHHWSNLFGIISWMFVGSGLGIVTPESTVNELKGLPIEMQKRASDFVKAVRKMQ